MSNELPWGTAWQTSFTGDDWHFAREASFSPYDIEKGIVKNITPLFVSPNPDQQALVIRELVEAAENFRKVIKEGIAHNEKIAISDDEPGLIKAISDARDRLDDAIAKALP